VYNPTIGRFLSPDPYVPDPSNTQSWNPYSYVENRPLDFTDPSGFVPVCVSTLVGRVGVTFGDDRGFSPNFGFDLVTVCFEVPDGLFLPTTSLGDQTVDPNEGREGHSRDGVCDFGPCRSVPRSDNRIGWWHDPWFWNVLMPRARQGTGNVVPKALPLILGAGATEAVGAFVAGRVAPIMAARAAINPKIYDQLGKQLARDGAGSIHKALRSAERTLAEHKTKLQQILKGGGHPSQVQTTIRNVESQIETIKKFITDNGL
jgi:hypothetical protein